jgi:hypothetical protein
VDAVQEPLFAGAARTPLVDGYLTLTSPEAAEAAELLGRPRVLPVHTDGWAHFTQDGASLRAAFRAAGLGDILLEVVPGKAVAGVCVAPCAARCAAPWAAGDRSRPASEDLTRGHSAAVTEKMARSRSMPSRWSAPARSPGGPRA